MTRKWFAALLLAAGLALMPMTVSAAPLASPTVSGRDVDFVKRPPIVGTPELAARFGGVPPPKLVPQFADYVAIRDVDPSHSPFGGVAATRTDRALGDPAAPSCAPDGSIIPGFFSEANETQTLGFDATWPSVNWLEIGTTHQMCWWDAAGTTVDFMSWFVYARHPAINPVGDWVWRSGFVGQASHRMQMVFEGLCPGTPCGWHGIIDVTDVWSTGVTNDGGAAAQAHYEATNSVANTLGTRTMSDVQTGVAFRGWFPFIVTNGPPDPLYVRPCCGGSFIQGATTTFNYFQPA